MKLNPGEQLAQDLTNRLWDAGFDMEESVTIAMAVLHGIIDMKLAQSKRTMSEIRATKKAIGEGVAAYLDCDLDPDVFEFRT